ncbi:hypothetical protein I350_03734 [Cryptococcus amylolentus CBS 6273]|nr:hypothetical protein I350_03734 [Cryptococcus amylolentus CBS 6273]
MPTFLPSNKHDLHHLRAPVPKNASPRVLEAKNHVVAMMGEFVGTTLFILFCLGGTHVAQLPALSITSTSEGTINTSSLFYISLSFGLSLAVNVWIFFRVSGGLFNPAVSLGMVLGGALPPLRGLLLTVSQVLGGLAGSAIADALVPGKLNAGCALGGGTSIVQGLFIEVFMTALLMLTIFFLAAEKNKATPMAPLGIGMALFIAEIFSVYYTGGALNPARAFGPAVVTHTFPVYHWIYWVGPGLGALMATGFYKLLKWLEYETVQQADDGQSYEDGERPDPETRDGEAARVESTDKPRAQQPSEAVYDLQSAARINTRLERIEVLLSQVLEAQAAQAAQAARAM